MEDEIRLKETLADLKVATRTICLKMRSLSEVVHDRCGSGEAHGHKPHGGRCCGSSSCKRKQAEGHEHAE